MGNKGLEMKVEAEATIGHRVKPVRLQKIGCKYMRLLEAKA